MTAESSEVFELQQLAIQLLSYNFQIVSRVIA